MAAARIYVPDARKAATFYESEPFGAELLRWSTFPVGDGGVCIGCYEVRIGSMSMLICDKPDADIERAPLDQISFGLNCVNLEASLAKAIDAGCKLVSGITEHTFRPGVDVATITDKYNQRWQLCQTSGGLGEDGFLNKEQMLVLLVAENQEEMEDVINRYRGTPQIFRLEGYSSTDDVMENRRRRRLHTFDPVIITPRNFLVAEIWRNPECRNFPGLIIGVTNEDDPRELRQLLTASGCDHTFNTLDLEILSSIFIGALKKRTRLERQAGPQILAAAQIQEAEQMEVAEQMEELEEIEEPEQIGEM